MRKHYKTFKYIILFLVADWFFIQQSVIPGFGKYNIRIGDLFFVYFFILYFRYIFNKNLKKSLIHYFYVFFLLGNIAPIYLGAQNTQLSYAFRDFQVISLSIAFFVGLFVINDINDIKKFINLFLIAFFLRELFLFVMLGAQVGYLQRFLTLADTSSTSYIQNLAIYFFLYKYLTIKNGLYRLYNIILVIFFSFTILALGKMGGILTLTIGFLIIARYTLKTSNFVKFAFIAIVSALFLINISGNELVQKSFDRIYLINKNIEADPTSKWRFLAWEQGTKVFTDHIIFGGGYSWPIGWFYTLEEGGSTWSWGGALHNEYLHILSSGGLMGFSIFIFFLIYIMIYYMKNIPLFKKQEDKILITILFAAFVSFLITAFTNPSWILYVSMVGWTYAAIGIRLIQIQGEPSK